jgi:hypothetical protein
MFHRNEIIIAKMSEKFDIEINSNHSPENFSPLRGKNYLQFDEDEKSFFLSNNNKKIYKDFYNILEKKINVKVVEVFEREENDEEFRDYEKECNDINNMIYTSNIRINSEESKYLTYSKWVAGIFQSIKDLEILDVSVNETIWDKIYPKENSPLKKNSHFPIYNPSGRYWIKLYFMGKHRKIEIDDYMPCNRDEEFLLPRCENILEIWPALLTKALIKLYSPFVNVNEDYSTIGDCSIIYSLTGYIGEKILLWSGR